MFHIIFARFKVHDSEFIIIGGIAYVIMWSVNFFFKYLRAKKTEKEFVKKNTDVPRTAPSDLTPHAANHTTFVAPEKKPQSALVKYSIWSIYFIVWVALCFALKYFFF